MQVTETSAEGLFREFKITIPAAELEEKLDLRLDGLKDKVNLKGFRPGKVPVEHLKKTFGRQVMGEIIEETLNESSQQALEERELRAAMQPKIDLESNAEDVLSGGVDLEFKIGVELMPEFELMDAKSIKLERKVHTADDHDINHELEHLAEHQRTFEDKGADAVAEDGDQVNIDFDGSIDGIAFDGGRGEGMDLVLGSGQFIPGFEEQLVGVKVGEEKDVNVTFPEEYPVDTLKGQAAVFTVKVNSIAKAVNTPVDDEFAKKMGMDDLAALQDAMRQRLQHDLDAVARSHAKRALLDALDSGHTFELPKGMVDAEFQAIWQQVLQDLNDRGKTVEDEAESEDALKAEYRTIAERRVRLGLVLAEFGKENNIDVTQEELGRALSALARQYPGQEREVYEYYQQNMGAMAQLRAPIFEDKVVDFILELADVTDKEVSKDELMKSPDEDE